MDIDLSPDQELFRTTAARFIDVRCPMANVRALTDDASLVDSAMSRAVGDLGWFAFFVPEEFGGGSVSDTPIRDAVIVAEERGRCVQPGPFVATNVVAFALAESGQRDAQERWLPLLASGEVVASWAIGDASGAPDAHAITAWARSGGLDLAGVAGLVLDGATAGLFLVTALDELGDVVQCVVAAETLGVEVTPLAGLDLTRQFAQVSFDNVRVSETSVLRASDPAAQLEVQIDMAVTLGVAESIGAMHRILEFTVDYAKDRTAFGRPIGSFQALKHLLADASLAVEVSSAGATAAADALADCDANASEIASIVKAYAGDAGIEVAQVCQQVHGGIGFTWEHDLHFFMRRLAVDRVLYGDPSWHRERICRIHGL